MTVQELHTAFKFGLDKLDSLNYPSIEPEEIDLLLNQAQDRYVKQRYGINNNKRQSFEETQKRTDDLKKLVFNVIITPAANASDNKPYGRFVTLPNTVGSEYWFAIEEECDITYFNCHNVSTTVRATVIPRTHDDYRKLIKDPFNKPDIYEIFRLMENGRVELISNVNITIGDYYLRYIKKPLRIDLNTNITCELSEHTHQEIIDEAIKIALEAIEAPRTPTFDKIITTTE